MSIESWLGAQSWLPGFLGGGAGAMPPETFGPKADFAPMGPMTPEQMAMVSPTSSMGGAKPDPTTMQQLMRRLQGLQRPASAAGQQPESPYRMGEWFGPRRIR